jgi:threonine/homoserine/homoserine lactone efflux protein
MSRICEVTLSALLPAWPTLLGFLLAAVVLAVTPGPGVLYIVTRTLSQGRAAGLASVSGVALGNLANAVAASLGLAALLAASSLAFSIVKFAGALYLVWLGLQMLRRRAGDASGAPLRADAPAQIFRQGFVVALLNPKTTLFFAAFLPQFIDSAGAPAPQALVLSTLFVGIAALSDSAYVLLARAVAPWFRGRGGSAGWGRYAAAAVYFGLGAYAALSGGRPARAG